MDKEYRIAILFKPGSQEELKGKLNTLMVNSEVKRYGDVNLFMRDHHIEPFDVLVLDYDMTNGSTHDLIRDARYIYEKIIPIFVSDMFEDEFASDIVLSKNENTAECVVDRLKRLVNESTMYVGVLTATVLSCIDLQYTG